MTKKNLFFIMLLVLSILSFTVSTVFPQGTTTGKDIQKVTIKGKIGFMERLGGYYVMAENPPSELFIVNQDKKVLERLKQRGKTVTIKGHFTIGADHLMIEKINGKKYSGKASK
jgi:hypothetical protein